MFSVVTVGGAPDTQRWRGSGVLRLETGSTDREGWVAARALGVVSMQSLYHAQSSPWRTRARDLLVRLVRPSAWIPNARVRLLG
jgi:hypothetical protein